MLERTPSAVLASAAADDEAGFERGLAEGLGQGDVCSFNRGRSEGFTAGSGVLATGRSGGVDHSGFVLQPLSATSFCEVRNG